jgi:hypothetical protein
MEKMVRTLKAAGKPLDIAGDGRIKSADGSSE